MNVRIEEQNLRFKISEEELERLLGGHCLHVKTSLLDKTLIVTINPSGCGAAMEPKLVLDENEVYLNLLISSSSIKNLSDMGRSRGGLQQEIGGLSVKLQVDVREDSRKVNK